MHITSWHYSLFSDILTLGQGLLKVEDLCGRWKQNSRGKETNN